MSRLPRCPSAIALAALVAALGLLAVAGCEAEKIPAAVACNNACEYGPVCGEADCWDRCMATSSDLEVFASCTTCITGAADDCEWRARCLSSCDGRALESPECAALCTGLAADCPGAAGCMDGCLALDAATRERCFTCVELRGLDCEAWNACTECRAPGAPAGGAVQGR